MPLMPSGIEVPKAGMKRLLSGGPFLAALVWATISGCDGGAADRRGLTPAVDIRPLLASTESPAAARSFDLEQFLDSSKSVTRQSPIWPTVTFLVGELHRCRGDSADAKRCYCAVAEYAATDPYGDGWGQSGHSILALWRWLQIIGGESTPDRNEVARLLDVAKEFQDKRLTRRMFATPVLPALPQLEEDIARRLALLAWQVGSRDRAQQLFLEYLTLTSTSVLGDAATQIMEQMQASGLVSPDRLSLLRGKRLVSLGNHDGAFGLLAEARRSTSADVRAEAGLWLAEVELVRSERKKGVGRAEVAALLKSVVHDAADPDVAQAALYKRALLLGREGPGEDGEQAKGDLLQLVEAFPHGRLAADALYQLARYFERTGDLEQALDYFDRLRNFDGPNDWLESAHLQAALALYTRGGTGDIEKASELLRELERRQPLGRLHFSALFWLGRMASESGDAAKARGYFNQIVAESPYDYYAVRARMHLKRGARATTELWVDPATAVELRVGYDGNAPDDSVRDGSAYTQRIRHALQTGLYSVALAAEGRFRERFPSRRLETVSLSELDEAGLLAPLGTLLALRQDALASCDALPTPEHRLQIAAAVGKNAQDWPLAMSVVMAGEDLFERRAAAQRDRHYLVTAYPRVFQKPILRAAAARGIRPELLYAVIRRESLFYPAALSGAGACGLLQFLPTTFQSLDRQWGLLSSSGATTREQFLLDPNRSIDLGARWFKDELLRRQRGNVVLALMEHQAGATVVGQWVTHWKTLGRSADLEYMIETFPFQQTRIFLRSVITDMEVADAVGMFNSPPQRAR